MNLPASSIGQAVAQARLADRRGELDEARRLYLQAVSQAPRDPQLLLETSVIEGRLGNLKSAERMLSKALKLAPTNPDIHYNLGQIARQEDQLDRAVRLFRRCLDLDPGHGDAAFALGEALYVQGKSEEALPWLERAQRESPADAEIRHVRALALDHVGRSFEALTEYREVLRLAPRHENAALNLAALAVQVGDPQESIDVLSEIEARSGIPSGGLVVAAKVYNLNGQNQRALELIEQSLAAGLNIAEALAARANLFMDQGDFDGAERDLREVVRLNGDEVHAWYLLAVMNRLTADVEPRLLRCLKDPTLSAESRANLYFALYHLHDRSGRFEQAFEALREANAIKALRAPFDLGRHLKQAERVISTFTPAYLESRRGQGFEGRGSILVTGMPRSGTTLTEQVLAAHPSVHAGGESLNVTRAIKQGMAWPESSRDLDEADVREQGGRLHEQIMQDAGERPFATDKTPANFMFFGAISSALPNARLVYVHRQPGDNALSLFEQNFMRGLHYSYDLAAIGAVYRQHVAVMDHWIKTCRLPIHTVCYDDLVRDPEPHIRALLDFVGLDFHPDCLTPNRVERSVRTSSVWQVRQPINAKSVGRWRRYEAQMQPFFRALEGEW